MTDRNCGLSRQERLEGLGLKQYGLLTTAQAASSNLSPEHLARSPRWVRIKPGLYRLAAHPDSWHQRLMAAVLAGGPGTAASHRSAALLHKLDGPTGETVEITVPRNTNSRGLPGVVVHRSPHLEGIDLGKVDNIPVTTVTRSLIDLGAVCGPETVEAALESGLRTGRTSLRFLHKRLAALGGRGRPGTAVLRQVLESRLYQAPTGSELETRFVQLCRRYGLPQGARQHQVDGSARVDFAWPGAQVLVELEGYGPHGTPADHRNDMRRQNFVVLARPGWTVLRYGWDDVVEHPGRVIRELECALGVPARRSG